MNRDPSVAAQDAVPGGRPDLRATFENLDDARSGEPFSYTVQVWNEGSVPTAASVSAIVPPALSNVRVTAPGFVCSRQFAASGPEVGTLVSCMRNNLGSGAMATITIEANAPSVGGTYHLTAVVDPRDEVAETNEANNQVRTTIQVGS